jgi:hypothetical protein
MTFPLKSLASNGAPLGLRRGPHRCGHPAPPPGSPPSGYALHAIGQGHRPESLGLYLTGLINMARQTLGFRR